MPLNERGQRVKTHNDTKSDRRDDVEKASNNTKGFCPTCGQKISASNSGGASTGGGS